jgi:hypothetical protein
MMEMTMKSKVKPRLKRQLSPEKLARRDAFFELYRDLGPGRSYERLIDVAKPKHGLISRRTLVNWSQQHNWRARIADYDQRLATGSQAQLDGVDLDFDMVEALERIARSAIHRVLVSHVEVRTPQDAKVMVEAAEKATTLAERLRQLGLDGRASEQKEAQVILFRKLMSEMRTIASAKDAAEGHPAHGLKDQHPEIDDAPDDPGVSPSVH